MRVGVAEQDGPTIWKITSSIQALASKRLLTKQISSVHFESQNQTWKDFLADFKAGSLCEILFVPAEMPLALHDCSQTGEMNGLRSALEIEYDLHDVRQRALLFFFYSRVDNTGGICHGDTIWVFSSLNVVCVAFCETRASVKSSILKFRQPTVAKWQP